MTARTLGDQQGAEVLRHVLPGERADIDAFLAPIKNLSSRSSLQDWRLMVQIETQLLSDGTIYDTAAAVDRERRYDV